MAILRTHGPLGGLHHVTAVTAAVRDNLSFYTRILGMRLVKRSVNQDDVAAYHLFYADAIGSPGTDLTFFDWPQTPPRRHGAGTIGSTGLRVGSLASLEWWIERLERMELEHEGISERAGRATLRFRDREGQVLTLVNDGGEPGGVPWLQTDVPEAHAIRGLGPVTLTEQSLDSTGDFLTDVLGFGRAGGYTDVIEEGTGGGRREVEVAVFSTGAGGPGAEVHVAVAPGSRGSVGHGGVHHVAFRTPDDEYHRNWQRHLSEIGVRVTPVIDRFYFRSLYFREPGGVLFEIATDGPGFAVDESPESLGERLALPPFLEPQREEIEAELVPLGEFHE